MLTVNSHFCNISPKVDDELGTNFQKKENYCYGRKETIIHHPTKKHFLADHCLRCLPLHSFQSFQFHRQNKYLETILLPSPYIEASLQPLVSAFPSATLPSSVPLHIGRIFVLPGLMSRLQPS